MITRSTSSNTTHCSQRLESAKISEQAEQSVENVKFRIIEPPMVPVKPSGPMRTEMNALVLFASIGAGAGLAVLLALMHPTFATRSVLEQMTGIRVIGMVSGRAAPWAGALVPSAGNTGGRRRRAAVRWLYSSITFCRNLCELPCAASWAEGVQVMGIVERAVELAQSKEAAVPPAAPAPAPEPGRAACFPTWARAPTTRQSAVNSSTEQRVHHSDAI